MSTIALSVIPLPPEPAPPDYLSAYDKIFKAERHAVQQVEINTANEEEKENLISARAAGYLLVELFNRRAILSERACASLAKQLMLEPRKPGGTDYDLVFDIGSRYREYFLRSCMFDFFPMSFGISVPL